MLSTDVTIRQLERDLAALDRSEIEHLTRLWIRTGRGWHGETLPPYMSPANTPGAYVWTKHGLDIEFVLVPATGTTGRIWVWSRKSKSFVLAAKPSIPVAGYDYLARYHVTWGQFEKFCAATGYRRPARPDWPLLNNRHPVVNVSWIDSRAFCLWAGLVLPTEERWLHAATFGSKKLKYPWGKAQPTAAHAHFGATDGTREAFDERGSPARPAGASAAGVFDMVGNAWQWLCDPYDPEEAKGEPEPFPRSGPPSAGPFGRIENGSDRDGEAEVPIDGLNSTQATPGIGAAAIPSAPEPAPSEGPFERVGYGLGASGDSGSSACGATAHPPAPVHGVGRTPSAPEPAPSEGPFWHIGSPSCGVGGRRTRESGSTQIVLQATRTCPPSAPEPAPSEGPFDHFEGSSGLVGTLGATVISQATIGASAATCPSAPEPVPSEGPFGHNGVACCPAGKHERRSLFPMSLTPTDSPLSPWKPTPSAPEPAPSAETFRTWRRCIYSGWGATEADFATITCLRPDASSLSISLRPAAVC